MSAFEDFVNLELPRRGVTFVPSMVGGYDGDPNDAGAPDVLKYSPAGTTYYQASFRIFWRKMSAAAGNWEVSIGMADLTTTAEIALYVDNINGDDTNDGSVGSPLKSLVEAEARLPFFINHRVVIRVLPYDASVPNAGAYTWPTFGARVLNEKILVVGDSYQTVSTGTAQAGTDQLHLVTTGGLTPDEYVTNLRFIKITSGAATGDIRGITENDATDIELTYPFSAVVNPGDTYAIIQPLIRFNVPEILDRCVLGRGVQMGYGAIHQGIPEMGIYVINVNMEFEEDFISIDEVPFMFFLVKTTSPEPTNFRSDASILAGVETTEVNFPSVRTPTLLESIPDLCPTISALSGCGLAVQGSLYCHTFNVGFDGYVVSTSNLGASLPYFDQNVRIYPAMTLRGGRCNGIYMGSTAAWNGGYLKIDTARASFHPLVRFRVRANTSSPAVRVRYCKTVLRYTDIQNAGSGTAISVVGLGSQAAVFDSTGSSSGGIGVVTEAGGEIRFDADCTFSGSTGDFSEDGGVTLRAWGTLLADTWFRDAVRGSLICRP